MLADQDFYDIICFKYFDPSTSAQAYGRIYSGPTNGLRLKVKIVGTIEVFMKQNLSSPQDLYTKTD